MTAQQGQYATQDALNRCLPIASRIKLGDILNTLINANNALAAKVDALIAISSGGITTGSGTLTVGGTITNGDSFKVQIVNAAEPTLVTPGQIVGPIPVVTADTTTTLATKLAAAINANAAIVRLGYTATSSAAIVTLHTVGAAGASTVFTATNGSTITCTGSNPTGGAGVVAASGFTAYALPTLASIP